VPSSRTAFGDGFFAAYFQPSPSDAFWEGHLEAYRLGPNFEILGVNNQPALDPSTGAFVEPRIPIWDTGLRLAGKTGSHPPRTLYTTDTAVNTSKTFSAANTVFGDFNILTTDLPLYLGGAYATQEALADALAYYIVGQDSFDDDLDTDTLETRDAVLGDIFHSSPIVIATPPAFHMGEEGFGAFSGAPDPATSFFARYALRDRRLYVGANDGMLHAVHAGTFEFGDNPATPTTTEIGYYDLLEQANSFTGGNEAFGYVPSFHMPRLKEIPLQTINNKSFFVDGDSAAADGWLPNNANDVVKDVAEWATVLISSMRSGGDGYLALDITDPSAVYKPYPNLMWEFQDANLGESWSKAVISRVRVRGGPGGDFCDTKQLPAPDCKERWVAIFAGGYTETGDAALPTLITNPADPSWEVAGKAIFMVDLKTGAVLAKAAYDPADAQLQNMLYAMPSSPAVLDIDFDGFIDLVYVGDTGGQIWKWDVSAIGQPDLITGLVDNWTVGRFFETPVGSNGHHLSVFNAPTASFIDGALIIAFGTGERTDMNYISDQSASGDANRFYVIEDPDPRGAASIPAAPYTEADLTETTTTFSDPDTTDLGFYLVADDGEKFVTNHIAFAGFIITASFTPVQALISDPCVLGKGQAFLYIFALDNGGGFFTDDGSGPTSTRRLSLGAGVPTNPNISTSGTGSGNKVFIQTSEGSVSTEDAPDEGSEPVGLVYWRQQL
jgi:type IV pilus assembly protein PilY1